MIKNLLKIESEKEIAKSKDIFKILLTLVLYIVIFGLFKAGLRILRDGTKVESIFGNKNVKILLNGKEINVNLIPETPVSENSLIQIFY